MTSRKTTEHFFVLMWLVFFPYSFSMNSHTQEGLYA